jgi:hypothetical protein
MNFINAMIEIKRKLDEAGALMEGREIKLLASNHEKEFKRGESMIAGIRINWVDDISEQNRQANQ